MPLDSVNIARLAGGWSSMGALASSDGSANHRYLQRLQANVEPLRDLADAAHYMCILHGRYPGVIDHAIVHAQPGLEQAWLESAAAAFATERAFLVRIVAAAGPLPSTPGHAESEAAAAAQRHALETLAQSDRTGCAVGAALALAIDWIDIRKVLDAAATRLNLIPPGSTLPPFEETATVIDALVRSGSVERAMLFGAQQLFAQHRGLWDLLEVRASARDRH
ncbi:MAG: hypothetical protein EOP61_14890 [Sphingomonadales bacterium]|nr:MAG: hypothetical protein EOP61_14890 [Sphingomonadales bacterium]